MNQACFECDYKQVDKVAQLVQMDEMEKSALKKEVQAYLKQCDMQQSNPAIMAEIWSLILTLNGSTSQIPMLRSNMSITRRCWRGLPEISSSYRTGSE